MLQRRFAFLVLISALALGLPAGAAAPKGPIAQATRIDPYKNFRFRLEIGGRVVAGFAKVSIPPARPPARAVVEHRSGGDPSTAHKSPGRNKFEAITLERGLTQDSDFARWAQSSAPKPQALASTREVSIVMVDERGAPVQAWRVHHAWVSEHAFLPNLDAGANSVAIEHLKLENEGWERGD